MGNFSEHLWGISASASSIDNRDVILDVAQETGTIDVDALAEGLDDGRARRRISDHFALAKTAGVLCSPHLYLADGTNHPNPGIDVAWNGDYGTGFPIVRSDAPGVYTDILERAVRT